MAEISNIDGVKIYTKKNELDLAPLNLFIVNGKIRFSRHTCGNIGLKHDTKIAFIFLGGWYMAITNEPDGYHIRSDGQRTGFACNASKVSRRLISALNPGKASVEAILEPTGYEYRGNKVYKIVNRLNNNKK